ncbi:hypothetical protein FA95DRAFT_1575811 [Auriscalpium vulgare]|uniref:Uncharacterized protein n=1 Tax=Auriscalpium vulgare TaxID=40419 RepID=A0ACB8REJ1_9AGAM|nr:hypothetical protein FA95DRAFT_1575811 [Auriscalpium vulgare]
MVSSCSQSPGMLAMPLMPPMSPHSFPRRPSDQHLPLNAPEPPLLKNGIYASAADDIRFLEATRERVRITVARLLQIGGELQEVIDPRSKQSHVPVDPRAVGDDFGTRRENGHSLPSHSLPSPSRGRMGVKTRRRRVAPISVSVSSQGRTRARSPPPPPRHSSPPPPVPPIPAAILAAIGKRPVLQPCSTNHRELLQIPEFSGSCSDRAPGTIRPTRWAPRSAGASSERNIM